MASQTKNSRDSIFLTLCIMGIFAILSSTMSKNPVLNPFATSLGTPEVWSGFVGSASTIPGILISLPAASLSDKYGRKKFLLMAGFVFASAPFLYLLITVWWQLILVRFYHGFATAIFVPVVQASIVELFPTKRGERISLFSSATDVGRGIAPFLGACVLLVTNTDFHMLYLAVGAAGVTAFIVALLFLVERRKQSITLQQENPKESVKGVFRGWRTVAGNHGVLIVSFVQACQFYTYGAVEFFLVGYLMYVVHFNWLLIVVISGSLIVMPIVAKPYMGRISDKIGRRIPIIVGCIIGSLPLLIIPFVSDFSVLLLLSVVYGLGFAMVTSSTPAIVSELVPKELIGTSMGFLATIMDAGQTIGLIITGMILSTNLAYKGSFPTLTAVLLLSCVIFALSSVAKVNYKYQRQS